MRKLLFFILFSAVLSAQEISPYYPTKQQEASAGREATQLTFYDADFVQGVIPAFLSNQLAMTQTDTSMDVKNGIIKQEYQDNFSTGKLVFSFKTDKIHYEGSDYEIVKSLKITGTPSRVVSFFVRFWDSTIDFESVRADVERKHLQDVVKLYFNDGKPYILVTNATYKTTKEFEDFFNGLVKSNANLHN